MIRHREKDWIISGNHQLIDGQVDNSECAQRQPWHEMLEAELKRKRGPEFVMQHGSFEEMVEIARTRPLDPNMTREQT